MMAIVPGALAIGLGIAAARTARAAPFGRADKPTWDTTRPPGVTQWLAHREDQPPPSQPRTSSSSSSHKDP